MTALMSLLCAGLVFSLLSACSKQVETVEVTRPVRAIIATTNQNDVDVELPGEVRARIESKLGFRVAGKIISRKVDVGSEVKKGQVLLELDPQDFVLAQSQAKAGLSAAESGRDFAKAELKRYQELRDKNFIASATLDAKLTAYKAAQASVDQAQAAEKNQSNQSSYTRLVADVDGVVTALEAEVGQVVAPGVTVVKVAQNKELDVVVGIPEDKVNAIRQISAIQVRLWANPTQVITAKLRELSPIADPVTRTYAAKLALPAQEQGVKLGMTAYASFVTKNNAPLIKLPLTALYHDKNTTFVWIVEAGVVKLSPVTIAGASGQQALLSSGVLPGQTVVTAGVNLLKAGQKVSILGQEPASPVSAKTVVTSVPAANNSGADK